MEYLIRLQSSSNAAFQSGKVIVNVWPRRIPVSQTLNLHQTRTWLNCWLYFWSLDQETGCVTFNLLPHPWKKSLTTRDRIKWEAAAAVDVCSLTDQIFSLIPRANIVKLSHCLEDIALLAATINHPRRENYRSKSVSQLLLLLIDLDSTWWNCAPISCRPLRSHNFTLWWSGLISHRNGVFADWARSRLSSE